ncbi:hypothetical protein H257_10008 [Aphanomyces astaci]|uniref:Tubulin-tyrosine ligase n=1 Tax=Aphanomyces astaci TaxID=112090 RepID=W4G987_APHAT|nr:hypothetical protein H257_10008 [Aphanomyces astaci]ETV75594.1 hypothetical protein H257_10008 [Aphanomyces astaci]|eukprot:XP_009834725.1 hypothetical protein H257_10008 [Aphanomyces astaci]
MLKHELGRKWRDIPWQEVLEKNVHADKYFMRSGLIRKDLLPLYAAEHMPRTFVVSSMEDVNQIIHFMEEEDKCSANDLWVLKLSDSSNAFGIHFFHRTDVASMAPILGDGQTRVVQKYVQSTLLDGKKFHLRVLVLAVGHLDVYVYDRCRVLVASAPFSVEALDNSLVHITNMGINQARNAQYDAAAQNRLLSDVFPAHIVANVMDQVHRISRHMFRAVGSNRRHFFSVSNCFELFGVDFMMDDHSRVVMLEVNPDPSLAMFHDGGMSGQDSCILPPNVLVDGVPPSFVQVYSRAQDNAFRMLKQPQRSSSVYSATCKDHTA